MGRRTFEREKHPLQQLHLKKAGGRIFEGGLIFGRLHTASGRAPLHMVFVHLNDSGAVCKFTPSMRHGGKFVCSSELYVSPIEILCIIGEM